MQTLKAFTLYTFVLVFIFFGIQIFNHHMIGNQEFSITIFLVCHCGLVISMKEYLKEKEEL